jgi:uncharacterized protein (DUF983 family)
MPDTSSSAPAWFPSLVKCKCPRCRTGRVYPFSALNPLKFSQTNDYCPHCKLKFEHETGFFWGAMYISYVFSAGIMIVFGAIAINFDWSFVRIMSTIIPAILVMTPFLYRYSRMLLLYLAHPYRHFDKKYL